MQFYNLTKKKKELNGIEPKNYLDNIKSQKILKLIFGNLSTKKKLEMIKYIKKIQKRLNISINDYEEFSKVELEIIPVKDKYSAFIHLPEDEKESFFQIYFNDSEEERKIYYIMSNDKGTKIKIKINFNVKNFNKLFYCCNAIESINFIKFYRNNINSMSYMFFKCSSLKILNLSHYNTENVTDMSGMFCECVSLKEIDLSNFNTNKVTNMKAMFYKCSSLKYLNLSNFNTENVTDMSNMFCGCSSLEEVDIINFKTNKVLNMECMFRGCSNELKSKIKANHKNIREEAFL